MFSSQIPKYSRELEHNITKPKNQLIILTTISRNPYASKWYEEKENNTRKSRERRWVRKRGALDYPITMIWAFSMLRTM
jgi:hypothetical protein